MARVLGTSNGVPIGVCFEGTPEECWKYIDQCEHEEEENNPNADPYDLIQYTVEEI